MTCSCVKRSFLCLKLCMGLDIRHWLWLITLRGTVHMLRMHFSLLTWISNLEVNRPNYAMAGTSQVDKKAFKKWSFHLIILSTLINQKEWKKSWKNVVYGRIACICIAKSSMHILDHQPDFAAQRSLVQEVIEEAGHLCIVLPKFHCEFNFIEFFWGVVKHWLWENCDYMFQTLQANLPKAMDSISKELIRKWQNIICLGGWMLIQQDYLQRMLRTMSRSSVHKGTNLIGMSQRHWRGDLIWFD